MLDVKSGDVSSFELLLRKYRTPVVNFLYRMVRDTAAAEDLAQEVFLRVYRARGQYLPTAKFTTWMFRIATNLALNALRDGRYRQQEVSIDRAAFDHSVDRESEPPALEIPDRQPSIELELIRRDRAEQIRRAVEALPEKQRAAVILHKYQDVDYRQIAQVLKVSESAVKSLLFRAYESLRVRLEPLLQGGLI
jgi:RNA polymerase sigma-70 factor (ECF subfamily)